jgi:hypothetical protein
MNTSRTPILGGIFAYRSLFWPITLICIGAVILLWNLESITPASMALFLRLWPLLLICAGLDLLVGRRSALLDAGLGVALVVLTVLVMLSGPALGLASEFKTYHYSEVVGEATAAQVNLDTHAGHLSVVPGTNAAQLATIDVTTVSAPQFTAGGTTDKAITLSYPDQTGATDWVDELVSKATVRLNPRVPVALDLNNGSGISSVDLSTLRVTGVNVNSGSGRMTLTLPAGLARYGVALNSGSGSLDVRTARNAALDLTANSGSGLFSLDVGDGADLTAQISSGSGRVMITVPGDAGLQVQVAETSGVVSLPSRLHQIGAAPVGTRGGLWESANFATASHKIVLNVQVGSGFLRVR